MHNLICRKMTCPACNKPFEHYSAGSNGYQLIRRDTDNCPYYEGVNPLFYLICVCPSCYFAASVEDFKLADKHRAAVKDALTADPLASGIDFQRPERSLFTALRSYQLASLCCQAKGGPHHTAGSLALRAAWICRYGGQMGRELKFIEQALVHYKEALRLGWTTDKDVTELSTAYLVGEMHFRSGQLAEAYEAFKLFLAKSSDPQLRAAAEGKLSRCQQATKIRAFLERLPIFAKLSNHGLDLLSVNIEARAYLPGSTICAKGEKVESMFVVTHGEVLVYVDDPAKPVSTLGEGSAFGEMSLLTGEPRSAAVLAGDHATDRSQGAVVLLEIGRTAFRNILQVEPTVTAEIASIVAKYKHDDESRAIETATFLKQMQGFLGLEDEAETIAAT